MGKRACNHCVPYFYLHHVRCLSKLQCRRERESSAWHGIGSSKTVEAFPFHYLLQVGNKKTRGRRRGGGIFTILYWNLSQVNFMNFRMLHTYMHGFSMDILLRSLTQYNAWEWAIQSSVNCQTNSEEHGGWHAKKQVPRLKTTRNKNRRALLGWASHCQISRMLICYRPNHFHAVVRGAYGMSYMQFQKVHSLRWAERYLKQWKEKKERQGSHSLPIIEACIDSADPPPFFQLCTPPPIIIGMEPSEANSTAVALLLVTATEE
jgi:hypothetical protein